MFNFIRPWRACLIGLVMVTAAVQGAKPVGRSIPIAVSSGGLPCDSIVVRVEGSSALIPKYCIFNDIDYALSTSSTCNELDSLSIGWRNAEGCLTIVPSRAIRALNQIKMELLVISRPDASIRVFCYSGGKVADSFVITEVGNEKE